MRSLVRSHRRVVLGVVALALVVFVGPAAAVTRQVAYGKPGAVQLVPVQGGYITSTQTPSFLFPIHIMWRAPAAPRVRQRICTFFQVTQAPTAPATNWTVAYTSPQFCHWIGATDLGARIGNHPWDKAQAGVEYHGRFVVTWATKKKKKLARATYDFNTSTDYNCSSTRCNIGTAPDKTAYITFHK